MISMCSSPRKPHRNPNPSAAELSGSKKNDESFRNQFKELKFDLDEAIRILVDPDPLFVANKMISSLSFSYLNGRRGIHITGELLGLDNPWGRIARQLGRDENEIKKTLDATVRRRNDIVHRADREKKTPDGPSQDIGYAWSRQAVDTVRIVCLCLDELVMARLKELREQTSAALAGVTCGRSGPP